MRISSVSNNENVKSNFKALKLADINSWDGKLMQEFVQNIEVQKFVKYWHDKGVDVVASGHGKSGISLVEDSSKPNRFFYGIYSHNGGVKNFDALEAIAQITKETKETIENIPLIQDAQDFVSKFNRALNINSAWQKASKEKNDADFYQAFINELSGIFEK